MTIVKESSAPLVVVVGSTGAQGGSVVRELARSDKEYRVRGLTRDATKPAAEKLKELGVEVHQVNLVVENAPAVKDAFKGAYAAFIVTNFWEHMQAEKEIAEGKLLIDAAAEGGAKRIAWSGLVSFSEASGGKLSHCVHFEGKYSVTQYGRAKFAGTDVAFVNVDAGLYMENFLNTPNPSVPFPNGDGTYTVRLPTGRGAKLPLIDIGSDYGQFVRVAFESEEFAKGGEIYTASEEISVDEVVQEWSEVTGKKITYEELSRDAFKDRLKGFGAPEFLLDVLSDNFISFSEVGCESCPVAISAVAYPMLRLWRAPNLSR
ncbi:NAD(P)-binding protein [Auricularia subglabra TFB-10046 SS5]|nr:NAD(P)-binding protein [Auricularia subglabra TFB-10046 SS5]